MFLITSYKTQAVSAGGDFLFENYDDFQRVNFFSRPSAEFFMGGASIWGGALFVIGIFMTFKQV